VRAKIASDRLNDPVVKYAGKNIIALSQDKTVGEAFDFLRKQNLTDEIVYIYIIDETESLVGVLPLRKLLNSDNHKKLSSIMVSKVISIQSNASVLDACNMFLKYRFLALPVVDKQKKIEGVIDISLFTDEVNAFAEKTEQNNLFQLIGIHIAHGKRFSIISGFKDRFPWLLFNILSGIICAFIAGWYETLISQVVLLAMFITVILALAESVSMQSMTITLQALAVKKVHWNHLLKTLRSEFSIAAVLGLGSGMVVGLIALIWKKQLMPTIVIMLSIFFAMISACLLGIIIPALIRRFRFDPRVAAGPIVLAVSDFLTLAFYFTLANWLIAH